MAQALREIAPEAVLTWIGTRDGMEGDLVSRAGIPFVGIPGGGLHGVALLNAVRNGWDLARATLIARGHLRRERPDAVLTTGGYVSGPVTVAARWQQVPMMVFVPDIEPAQSIKATARFASRVAVTVEDSLAYFTGGKAVVTGYPLGERITRWTREEGREALGIEPSARVLLVFGGSRGARSINRAVMANVEALVQTAHVVHVSGRLDWPEAEAALQSLPQDVLTRYHLYPYLHDEMGAALAAADLVVSRAGAGVLGEFPYFGLPAILVPYPHAWRYQKVNAEWLASRGAALVLEDGALAAELVPAVRSLWADDARRAAMAEAARALGRPSAARDVAGLLVQLGKSATPG